MRNLQRIVTEALRKVQRFSSDWQANTFAGGTVRKITRGMWAMDTFEDTILMGLLPAITIMVGVTVMLTLWLPAVGLASGAMIAVYCAGSIWSFGPDSLPAIQGICRGRYKNRRGAGGHHHRQSDGKVVRRRNA